VNKKKLAVLGGGLGSMAALAWLTSDPGTRDAYDITVYQLGWRLGGKGASGRNAAYGERVEEHGLHIWFGFYENAFRTLRHALDALHELDPKPVRTFADVDAAFTPQSLVTFEEWWKGQWSHWTILFPPNHGVPGRGPDLAPVAFLETALGWMVEAHDAFFDGRAPEPRLDARPSPSGGIVERLLAGAAEAGVTVAANAGGTLLHQALAAARGLPGAALFRREAEAAIAELVRLYLEALWWVLAGAMDDAEARRFFVLNDLAGTFLVGILRDDLLARGFEAADGEDWVEWLARHGAREVSTTSAPIRTVYDLVFGFEGGDTDRPDFAAGTATRGLLRMLLTYQGALMFKMNAGMGDTIFTPFYGLLKHRGVRFEFFHKVDALRLSPDGDAIDRLEMTRQVHLRDRAAEYWPLREVKDLDCWPSEPLWEQIEGAERLREDPYDPGHPYDLESWWTSWPGVERRTLVRGEDFDVVLCGIPVGALRHVASELVARLPSWKRMVEGDGAGRAVQATPTQGVQLWMTKTSEQLGWQTPAWALEFERSWGAPIGLSALLGGYAQALDTWADMSHLLPVEDWKEGTEPASVQYWCGPWQEPAGPHPFSDHGYPRRERERLLQQAMAWASTNAGWLWPAGRSPEQPTGLDPNLLVDPRGGTTPEARWRAQWLRVNVDPNELYVLSTKGSTASRLAAGGSGVANLVLAGDWTSNPVLNAGCVEAAVTSGMMAARALGASVDVVGAGPAEEAG
jgi:uncharacterized protein with NAD-binding domain and iron-sulfur cluster